MNNTSESLALTLFELDIDFALRHELRTEAALPSIQQIIYIHAIIFNRRPTYVEIP